MDLREGQAAMKADIANLEGRFDVHEKRQNGSIQRIEEKLESARSLMMGLMGSAILSLVLLIANLVVKR